MAKNKHDQADEAASDVQVTEAVEEQPSLENLIKPEPAQPDPAPVQQVQIVRDKFAEYVKRVSTLPAAAVESLPAEAVNPNAFPPEIEELRKQGVYEFCWVRRPGDDEQDWIQMRAIERAGYILVTRMNMGEAVPDYLFDAENVVPRNDQVLFVCKTSTREARRIKERGIDKTAIEAGKAGHDEQGAIPYATDFGAGLGSDQFEIPGQIGHDAPFVEDEVDPGGRQA